MSFGLGLAGGGAADALKDILQQRALQQELAERQRSNMAEEALRGRQIDAEGQNQSLLQQLHIAQFVQGQQQAQQAEQERQGAHIETSTPIGGDIKLQDVPTLVNTGRSNLLKAKPIDVGMGQLQTKLGGDASTMVAPTPTGGGFADAGNAAQQHQAITDDRLQTAADLAARKADDAERHNRVVEGHMATMDAKAAAAGAQTAAGTDDYAEGVTHGLLPPPNLSGGRMSKDQMALGSALAKRGYDVNRAWQDYTGAITRMRTMNGPAQTKMQENVALAEDMLPTLENLAKEWQGGGFPMLNSAALAAAKSGINGTKAQALANAMDAQIKEFNGVMGGVLMGSNSPTDKALALASSELKGEWSLDTMQRAFKQIRNNLQMRRNSIKLAQSALVSPGSAYDYNNTPAPGGSTAPAVPGTTGGNGDPMGLR